LLLGYKHKQIKRRAHEEGSPEPGATPAARRQDGVSIDLRKQAKPSTGVCRFTHLI